MNDQAFNRFIRISLVLIGLIYLAAMATMDLINIDSSQYALISKEMSSGGSYLQVYCRGEDYLDKPPLLFWLSSLSIALFGEHDWAFRLPAVLTLALGIYSLYRFARIYHPERVARLSAVVMSAAVATYCMVTDVRTDTMLTGWVMFTFWQLAEFYRSAKLRHMLSAAAGIGLAMLAKVPSGW